MEPRERDFRIGRSKIDGATAVRLGPDLPAGQLERLSTEASCNAPIVVAASKAADRSLFRM